MIDTRERQPFEFNDLVVQHDGNRCCLSMDYVVRKLGCGDYAIDGLEGHITVERKSTQDLIQTISSSRKRFIRQLERMQSMHFSAVVIECEWMDALRYCKEHTQYNPVSLDSTILAFCQRYPKTHWFWRDCRRNAAKTTYKILDRFWKDKNVS